MDFSLSDEHGMIRDAAADFLAQAADSAALRTMIDSGQSHDAALWAQIGAELGWCGTAIPEEFGGLGLGPVAQVLLFEQLGRRLAGSPFFASVALASTALIEAGSEAARARWLPRLAAGELRATLSMAARGVQFDTDAPGATAKACEGGWRLDGRMAHVPEGDQAELLLVLARMEDGGLGLFAVPGQAAGVTRQAHATWDATRRLASVELRDLRVDTSARVDAQPLQRDVLERIEARAALLLAAEQLGAAQQCLDLSVAYTAERVQFGQPIAAFQAVKHRCAEMMVAIEATRSLVYGAAALADGGGEPGSVRLESGAAKAAASEAFFFCAQEAIQLHGGVGFTWEYDPQLYFKRAQASLHWLGSPTQWRERIAAALLD